MCSINKAVLILMKLKPERDLAGGVNDTRCSKVNHRVKGNPLSRASTSSPSLPSSSSSLSSSSWLRFESHLRPYWFKSVTSRNDVGVVRSHLCHNISLLFKYLSPNPGLFLFIVSGTPLTCTTGVIMVNNISHIILTV